MKRVAVGLLIAFLLVPLLATPADARWRHHGGGGRFAGGVFLGLGLGALLTAPFWYYPPAYAYPVYTPAPYPAYYPAYTPTYSAPTYYPPAYSAPAYTPPASTPTYPTPQPLTPAPPGGAEAAPAPQSGGVPPGAPAPQVSAQNCQTVWVEGHWETRVMATGERVTAWVPAHAQQVCQ